MEQFVFERIDPEPGEPEIVRGRERHAVRAEPEVLEVRSDGVVREIVVACPCGCRTRIRLEYAEGERPR